MATQSIQGLFGGMGTPEEMQRALIEQKAAQFAEMNQNQQLSSMAYKGGANLGQGLASAFGVNIQDPTIQRATRLRQLASQYNTDTAKGLRDMAAAVRGMGDYESAAMLVKRAEEMDMTEAKLASERATAESKTAEKLTNEQKIAADIVNKTPGILAGSPQWFAAYKKELERLTAKAEGRPNIKEVGVSTDTGEAVYTYQTGNDTPKQVVFKIVDGEQKMVPFVGRVDRTTAKVSATATSKGADEGAKTSAELDAKRVNAAQVASDKAIEQADVLQQLLKTPQPISGTGAPARVAALRVFSTVGLTSPKDNEALSNADKFNSLAGERVLTFIKTLGTNPTDSDREFARTIGPALEKGTKTNQDLANYLLKRARETTQAAQAMEEHYYNNNYSLRGYKSPFLSKLETQTPASGMSADDLAKAAGGKIVNGKFVKD